MGIYTETITALVLTQEGEIEKKVASRRALSKDGDVVAFWAIKPELDRELAWDIVVEGLAWGAKRGVIDGIADYWRCDERDADQYLLCCGLKLVFSREDGYRVMLKIKGKDSKDLVGRGCSTLDALVDLCRKIAPKPDKKRSFMFRGALGVRMNKGTGVEPEEDMVG